MTWGSKAGGLPSLQVRADFRAVAQASAKGGKDAESRAEGSRGRRFKSCQPDQKTGSDQRKCGVRAGSRFELCCGVVWSSRSTAQTVADLRKRWLPRARRRLLLLDVYWS